MTGPGKKRHGTSTCYAGSSPASANFCIKERETMEHLKDNEYRCDVCKKVFESGWSDEEATEEKEKLFGDVPDDECGIVCDDCFIAMGFCPGSVKR